MHTYYLHTHTNRCTVYDTHPHTHRCIQTHTHTPPSHVHSEPTHTHTKEHAHSTTYNTHTHRTYTHSTYTRIHTPHVHTPHVHTHHMYTHTTCTHTHTVSHTCKRTHTHILYTHTHTHTHTPLWMVPCCWAGYLAHSAEPPHPEIQTRPGRVWWTVAVYEECTACGGVSGCEWVWVGGWMGRKNSVQYDIVQWQE